jgi:hypothetical protein
MLKHAPKWVDMHINLKIPMPLKSLTFPINIDEQLCDVHVSCLQLKVMLRSWILWLQTTIVQLQNTHMVQRGQRDGKNEQNQWKCNVHSSTCNPRDGVYNFLKGNDF